MQLPRPVWFALLALALLLAGALGYTGSSGLYAVKRSPLLTEEERDRHAEVLGFSREIRSDEHSVEAPLERAQQLARPAFPLVNLKEGLGQLQRSSYPLPVLDWGIAFRPLLWPLLLGTKWSFGPRWFLRTLVVLLGVYAWLGVVTFRNAETDDRRRARRRIVAIAAVAVLYSSAVSWWMSTPMTEIVGFCGLGVAAGRRLAAPRRWPARVSWLCAAFYLFACAFFAFYPPVWGPVLWIVAATSVDAGWRETHKARSAAAQALPVLCLAAAAAATAIAYYAPYLLSVLHTAYPGQRRVTGGGTSALGLLSLAWPSMSILAPGGAMERYLGGVALNVCEASAIEVIPLFALVAACTVEGPIRRAMVRTVRSNVALLLASAVLAAWAFVPLPEPFGTLTLLRFTPASRAWFVLGAAGALLGAALLAELDAAADDSTARSVREAVIVLSASAAMLVGVGFAVRSSITAKEGVQYSAPLALAFVLTLTGVLYVRTRVGAQTLALSWAAPLVIANILVNPLVRSSDLFAEGRGHGEVRAAIARAPGRLLDYDTHFGARLSGYGIATLSGVYLAPDLGLFKFLEPEARGLEPSMYNRYARVTFALPPARSRLLELDATQVALSPCSRRLTTLWVNHFLAPDTAVLPDACAEAFDIVDVGDCQLWSRKAPVQRAGVAKIDAPSSALDFDFTSPNDIEVTAKRDALLVGSEHEKKPFATAVNLSLIDRVTCLNAAVRAIDTHVVVTPTSVGAARCEITFLGSAGALAQLFAGQRATGL